MKELLMTAEFHEKFKLFIQENLCAYIPGLESADSVKAIPIEKDIAFNQPPNPKLEFYDDALKDFELRLARAEQIHTCHLHRCLVQDKKGKYRCKR